MRYFITTTIPYVNADPHIGFLWELLIADYVARFQKSKGNEVRFIAGTDENGLKIAQAAESIGKPTKDFVDEYVQKFFDLNTQFEISIDDFIRTTEKRHKKGVYKLWNLCKKNGDIYEDTYEGLYCVGCEDFYRTEDLIDGKCPDHKKEPELIKEKNYFFRLKKYLPEIARLVKEDKIRILPDIKKQEVLRMIASGDIGDLSISRSKERSRGWGIPVEGDENQMVYVWFDALTNYISALDFGEENSKKFETYWNNAQVWQFLGKNVLKFHALYWPAMLLSAGQKTPDVLHVHEFVTNEGEKMSKSLGNVVAPKDLLGKYDVNITRYYFAKQNPFADFNFSFHAFEQTAEGELKKEIGNFVSRVFGILKKAPDSISLEKIVLQEEIEKAEAAAIASSERGEFHVALQEIYQLVKRANKFIDEKQLWKGGEETEYAALLKIISLIAFWGQVFSPQKAKRIHDALNLKPGVKTFENKRIAFDPLF